jgi:tryptophan synthase alpha chain
LVGVGLGVSNGAQAREVTAYADAVIVGSALVRTLLDAEDAGTPDDLSGLRAVVADLAAGVRQAPVERFGATSAPVAPASGDGSPAGTSPEPARLG